MADPEWFDPSSNEQAAEADEAERSALRRLAQHLFTVLYLEHIIKDQKDGAGFTS